MSFPRRPSWFTMRNIVPLCLLSQFITPLSLVQGVHAQEQLWLRQFGTTSNDWAASLVADDSGGVFIGGHTSGNLGGPNAGPSWTNDAYLARHDSAGNQLWIRQFGTAYNDRAVALASDGSRGVIVAGPTGVEFSSEVDILLTRFDETGERLWTNQFGSNEFEYVGALSPDGAGGVFVGGRTQGDLGGPNAGGVDAFVGRFDARGNQLWMVQFGTADSEWTQALVPDGEGGVIAAGWFNGNLFRPMDAFVARFDGMGRRLWFRQFGTNSADAAGALASDGEGGVYVSGSTDGDLGGPSAGGNDAFLARYNGMGDRLWIRQFGTPNHDGASALVSVGAGGVLVSGYFQGVPGATLFKRGLADVFLARYDASGNELWTQQFGTPGYDLATALASDGVGGAMIAGVTDANLGGPNAGETDIFLARFIDSFCYADCDTSTGVGTLDLFDFLCFQNSFVSSQAYACDCDTSTGPLVCDLFDFLCFQDAFVGGCS